LLQTQSVTYQYPDGESFSFPDLSCQANQQLLVLGSSGVGKSTLLHLLGGLLTSLMKLLKLAWKNIIHNPLNLALSVILFGLGIGLINFLILFNTQLKNKFDSNLAGIDLVIGAKGSPLQMILSSMYHVDSPTGNVKIDEVKAFLNPRHPLIKAAVPLSLGDSYKSYRIVGTTDSLMSFYHADLSQGRMYDRDLEVVVGRAVADDTGLEIGHSFKSSHGFNDDDDLAHDHAAFKVVGILEGTGSVIDQLILTNPSTVWSVHDHNDEPVAMEEKDDDHDHTGHDHDDHDHDGDGHLDHAAEDHHDHASHGDDDHDHDVPMRSYFSFLRRRSLLYWSSTKTEQTSRLLVCLDLLMRILTYKLHLLQ